jgi:glutaredoxin
LAAREDHARRHLAFEYINVKKDKAALERMLALTKGRRDVPVIADGDEGTIGFGGT